jgi:aminopeptidase-like protein
MSEEISASEIDGLLARMYPFNRSLTGDGNRQTLNVLRELVPLDVHEYPCGKEVYDWVIPDEWHIRDAWIKDSTGNRLVDFQANNLHVVGYSEPVKARMTFNELSSRLHVLEELPEAIPYRTSYYTRSWGFCVNSQQYKALQRSKEQFEVVIDSAFDATGSMSIGELLIPGAKTEELLVSTYICHPSMANDNLSGIVTTALLAKTILARGRPQYSWRFVFVPETIGAIAYLCHNEKIMHKVQGGFVVTCCGGKGKLGYKESFVGDSLVDRAVRLAFRDKSIDAIRYPFQPTGSDERQYSSIGFRIPVTTICKDKYYEYSEYHTSLDNLDFVNGEQILESVDLYLDVIQILEENSAFTSSVPKGEVQLGRRGLYPHSGGSINQPASKNHRRHQEYQELDVILWLLFLSDGQNDLITIAERTGITYFDLLRVARKLMSQAVIQPAKDN